MQILLYLPHGNRLINALHYIELGPAVCLPRQNMCMCMCKHTCTCNALNITLTHLTDGSRKEDQTAMRFCWSLHQDEKSTLQNYNNSKLCNTLPRQQNQTEILTVHCVFLLLLIDREDLSLRALHSFRIYSFEKTKPLFCVRNSSNCLVLTP